MKCLVSAYRITFEQAEEHTGLTDEEEEEDDEEDDREIKHYSVNYSTYYI